MLILRTTRTAQPQQTVGVDWGNPLTRGLVFADPGTSLSNAALMQPMGRTGTRSVVRDGQAWRGFGASGIGSTDAVNTGFNGQSAPITIFARYIRTGLGGNGVGRLWERSTADTMLFSSGVPEYYRAYSGGTGIWAFSVGDGSGDANVVVSIAVSSTGVASDVPQGYVNGRTVTLSTTAGTSGTPNAGTSNYFIGNNPAGARNWDGFIGEFLVWHRILSPAEVAAVHRNPWQLFAPEPRRIWVPGAVGPSTPTLSAPTVINITATSATPRVTITI